MSLAEWPTEEIEARYERCIKKMKEKNLNGLVLTNEYNIYYFTGYRTHAPFTTYTRPLWLFIPSDGHPVLFAQVFTMPEAKSKSIGCEVRGYDSLTGSPINEILEILKELNMDKGQIGWELGHEQRLGIPVSEFQKLRELMKDVDFVDASELIWDLRSIKSPLEIDCVRKACSATSAALDKCFKSIHEGMTEKEISRIVFELMLQNGAEKPGFVIIVSGEGNYERISGIATNRRIRKGDLVWIDAGANHKGYWSDFCRAGVVGEPTDEQKRYQEKVHIATMEAIKNIVPGKKASEIAYECFKQMERQGLSASFECGRMGHGMGLMSTEPPSIASFDNTIIKPGMIINIEPGVVNSFGVFDIEENLVITETGCDILSGAERTLYPIATD